MTEYVCGFYCTDTTVLLIRKARPAWQRGRLNGVGGHVEPGETPRRAMAREFREETGQETAEADWSPRVVLTGADWRVHFFVSRGSPFRVRPADDLTFPIEVRDHSTPAVNGAAVRSAN